MILHYSVLVLDMIYWFIMTMEFYITDQDTMKQYLSGQEEINAILGQPSDDIPDVFIHKPKR